MSQLVLTRGEFERICDEVYAEDATDVLKNGWAGGRNGYEQDSEILERVALLLEVEL